MAYFPPTRGFVWQRTGGIALARIINDDGAYLTQADLTAITCGVFDLDSATPDEPVATPAVTVALDVFDALQASAADLRLWTVDEVGFNFKHKLPDTAFSLALVGKSQRRRYRVEYLFDPASGADFALVFDVESPNLRSYAG